MKGRDVREHIDRFSKNGKYYLLQVNDYVVLDFRRGPTASSLLRHPNRITVFFDSEDFSTCQCVFGDEPDPLN